MLHSNFFMILFDIYRYELFNIYKIIKFEIYLSFFEIYLSLKLKLSLINKN